MHYVRLISLMEDSGVSFDASNWIADEEYQLPTRRWLEKTFAPAWTKLCRALKFTYQVGSFDCDDFADICAAYARLLHSRSKKRKKGTGLAFGVFSYVPQVKGHAINVVIVPVDEYKAEPVLFEPQPPTQVFSATPAIMRTCKRYRF